MRSLLVLSVLVSSCIGFVVGAQPFKDFVVSVDQQGSFFVSGTDSNESAVVEQARAALNRDAATVLVVEANALAPYESVKRAIELLHDAGAEKISFRTKTAQ